MCRPIPAWFTIIKAIKINFPPDFCGSFKSTGHNSKGKR